jgi:hypothetical protein
VDKNTTVVFPAPLMTTIAELGSFVAREPPRPDGEKDFWPSSRPDREHDGRHRRP